MFINIFRKGTRKLNSGVETWIVQWFRIQNDYGYGKAIKCYQAFTDKEEAESFAEIIKRANKLIGNDFKTMVRIEKQISGLKEAD